MIYIQHRTSPVHYIITSVYKGHHYAKCSYKQFKSAQHRTSAYIKTNILYLQQRRIHPCIKANLQNENINICQLRKKEKEEKKNKENKSKEKNRKNKNKMKGRREDGEKERREKGRIRRTFLLLLFSPLSSSLLSFPPLLLLILLYFFFFLDLKS